jgi:hypothetical protein
VLYDGIYRKNNAIGTRWYAALPGAWFLFGLVSLSFTCFYSHCRICLYLFLHVTTRNRAVTTHNFLYIYTICRERCVSPGGEIKEIHQELLCVNVTVDWN